MRPADILGSTEVYTVDGHDYLERTFEWYDDFLESCPALRGTKEAMDPESIKNIQFRLPSNSYRLKDQSSSTRLRVVAKGNFLDLRLYLGS